MLSHPLLLHYYITNRCNCRCRFCDIWKTKPHQDAELSDVLLNLETARRVGVRFVDFTGGEPLLHRDLPEMLRRAKGLGYQTSVTTNGLLYPHQAEDLSGLVDFLHFSLDALDADLHNDLRGGKVFDKVMQSIDCARALGEIPDLLFTVTHHNYKQIRALSLFARQLGLILLVNPVFSHTSQHGLSEKILRELERYSSSPYVYLNKAFHRLRRNGGNQILHPRCRVVDSTIVVSADNKVLLPCYFFSKQHIDLDAYSDYSRIEKKGNLHNRTQEHHSIEDSPPYFTTMRKTNAWKLQQRKQGRYSFCQNCVINCYFDPSFVYKVDEYFGLSAVAKARYWWTKHVRRKMERNRLDKRPAIEIADDIMKQYKP